MNKSNMESLDYKEYHNTYMHSNGTSAEEIVSAIVPTFLYEFIGSSLSSFLLSYVTKNKIWIFLLEFLIVILPLTLHVTVLSDYLIDIINVSILFVIAIVHFCNNLPVVPFTPRKTLTTRKNFLTNARATTHLAAVVAILAVDFRIFPRRFTKTATYGFGLMDVGVGYIIFYNGILAPEIRGKNTPLKVSVRSSVPLFILGAIRFLLTKEVDYHVPVSEYGVHWNFFITLTFTKILTSAILSVVRVKYILFVAVSLIITHEILLQKGLANFVLEDTKRDNFITANKEGLVSTLGYISLYLLAVYFGYWLDMTKTTTNKISTTCKFIFASITSITLAMLLENHWGISRRLANSAFCFWNIFLGVFMAGLFYIGETTQEYLYGRKFEYSMYVPYILEAINYNGLVFFLLCNIMTGLINVLFETMNINSIAMCLLINVGYMFVSCLTICILYEKQIKLKL